MHTFARHLPLAPLLHAYTSRLPGVADLGRLPGVGRRFGAVLSASARFLFAEFVDSGAEIDFTEALVGFYEACVDPPLHVAALRRKSRVVRHALAYLLRGRDPLPTKAANCMAPGGSYFVAGLGPSFWSALIQGTCSTRHPAWTPETVAGLRRLGLASRRSNAGPAAIYAALQAAHARIRGLEPALCALHIDHFLTRVAAMPGRDIWAESGIVDPMAQAIARQQGAPADRLERRRAEIIGAREQMEDALARHDGAAILTALATADPAGASRANIDGAAHSEALALWVGRLWEARETEAALAAFWDADPIPGAGLWLPPALLHVRDPERFFPWNDNVRLAIATLTDAAETGSPTQRYLLFNEAANSLAERYEVHPLELPAILESLASQCSPGFPVQDERSGTRSVFRGFSADTFAFLGELAHNNRREWMDRQRARYCFSVREPLVELCRSLASRYITPVLHCTHGWDVTVEARSGHALTSICKNAYGRGSPYNTALWIAFCKRSDEGPRAGPQFFVRLGAGVRFGLILGKNARSAVARLQRNVEDHADLLVRVLRDGGALSDCRFGPADLPEAAMQVTDAADLRAGIAGRSCEISRCLPANSPLLGSEELAGEVLLTFDRLLPLFACAIEEDAGPFLLRRLGVPDECFTEADFRRTTWLGDEWLRRARGLLAMKRQLILQGVPGTGKTHVARALARVLTAGRPGAIRLVQFHPGYSYEEFVEGIKVRSVDVGGRHEVSYPVEDGLLCAFAAEAERRPAEPFVLLIDEINRGNLPRIFGELLYLLEYRGQAIDLPYSRRSFRLPSNLFLIGTMNAADRSVAVVDQALRRRFSFLEMPPDSAVLKAWLDSQIPAVQVDFAERVLTLFTRLNTRLGTDLGPQARVGHSYFMVPGLDEPKLRVVWQHHVRPVLEEYYAGQPARLAACDLDVLLDNAPRGASRSRVGRASNPPEIGVPGAFSAMPK